MTHHKLSKSDGECQKSQNQLTCCYQTLFKITTNSQCHCGIQATTEAHKAQSDIKAQINVSSTEQNHKHTSGNKWNETIMNDVWLMDTCRLTNSTKAPTEMKHMANVNPT